MRVRGKVLCLCVYMCLQYSACSLTFLAFPLFFLLSPAFSFGFIPYSGIVAFYLALSLTGMADLWADLTLPDLCGLHSVGPTSQSAGDGLGFPPSPFSNVSFTTQGPSRVSWHLIHYCQLNLATSEWLPNVILATMPHLTQISLLSLEA